jgi:UDP-N-acetylglucosamine diphosphorylase/glucosamine-1-phosphate N-acetyltransferase
MNYILLDTHWQAFLPLTFTRPVSHLLIGIDTIAEKWTRHLGDNPSVLTAPHLRQRFPAVTAEDNVLINSAALPTAALVEAIRKLESNQVLTHNGKLLAARVNAKVCVAIAEKVGQETEIAFSATGAREVFFNEPVDILQKPADLFSMNDKVLRQDFKEITKNIRTTDLPKDIITKGHEIFIEEGAVVNHCVLNASTGPIYIAKDAEIMEGALIRGPFAIGAHSTVKMGAKIYGATTIGTHCKVGGEISNSIVHNFSNKGHDGFLGNSVIGSWCNLGADTNTSNLKNNYGKVRVWDYPSGTFADTGLLFHGLVMGDHAKAGINTMFNTGTVVGACANVFDGGFPAKFLPSFSWGTAHKMETFDIDKAFEAAAAMMVRRNVTFDKTDEAIFRFIQEFDAPHR